METKELFIYRYTDRYNKLQEDDEQINLYFIILFSVTISLCTQIHWTGLC